MLSYLDRGNVTVIVVGGGQFKGSGGGARAGGCHENHDSRNKKNDLHEDNGNGFSDRSGKNNDSIPSRSHSEEKVVGRFETLNHTWIWTFHPQMVSRPSKSIKRSYFHSITTNDQSSIDVGSRTKTSTCM
jgi:hypothetical protein